MHRDSLVCWLELDKAIVPHTHDPGQSARDSKNR